MSERDGSLFFFVGDYIFDSLRNPFLKVPTNNQEDRLSAAEILKTDISRTTALHPTTSAVASTVQDYLKR